MRLFVNEPKTDLLIDVMSCFENPLRAKGNPLVLCGSRKPYAFPTKALPRPRPRALCST